MTRYQFLKNAGFTGASLWSLLACVSEDDKFITPNEIINTPSATPTVPNTSAPVTTTPGTTTKTTDVTKIISTAELTKITNTKLKIDLTINANKALLNQGGYQRFNNTYVVALSKAGLYIAAPVLCTHDPLKDVIYSNEEWYCTAHGARFTLAGKGLNKNGNKGLVVYKTVTDGKTLVIY